MSRYGGRKLNVIEYKIKKEEIDGYSGVDVIVISLEAQFEIRTRTQFEQFTVSLSCYGNRRMLSEL